MQAGRGMDVCSGDLADCQGPIESCGGCSGDKEHACMSRARIAGWSGHGQECCILLICLQNLSFSLQGQAFSRRGNQSSGMVFTVLNTDSHLPGHPGEGNDGWRPSEAGNTAGGFPRPSGLRPDVAGAYCDNYNLIISCGV